MTMPRLSLYRPNRTYDYQYLDRNIKEMFTVGGIDIYIHKYLGPVGAGTDNGNNDATIPNYNTTNPLFIEDLLLLENRDRVYAPDVFVMRGVYRTQDIDFDLTQFGLFLNGDTLFITFHYNNMIDTLGRKLMSGDVIEIPNLRDYHPLDTTLVKSLPRYYVIQDGNYASEGFSQTWQPHLWRIKATNIWDPGNFYPAGETVNNGGVYYQAAQNVPPGTDISNTAYWTLITNPATVGDKQSTRPRDLAINDALLAQAQEDVPLSGYDNVKFYILPTGPNGEPASAGLTADDTNVTVDGTQGGEGITPDGFGYAQGYLTGSTHAPNGLPVTPGVQFPPTPVAGDYCLRLDYFPNRLFRYNGNNWLAITDNVRTDLDYATQALTQRASFVNNTFTVPTTDIGNIPSRQSLSKILEIQPDNGDQGGNITPPNPRPPGR